ncbi:MAG: aldo/keto reductase [Schleiferiaceae bacterium]|nr:aldo/keto reductase [Schleiferiaceae bacterium]
MKPFSPFSHGYWRLMEWDLQPTEIAALVEASLDMGIYTIDHADIYGDYRCEAAFGQGFAQLSSATRQKVQLVSKCGIKLLSASAPDRTIKHYDYSYAHIVQSAENSLKRLHAEKLDVLLLHRPSPLLQPDEVARAFSDLKLAGKVVNFGVSNYTTGQFDALQGVCEQPLVTNQVQISPLHVDYLFDGGQDHALLHDYSPMAWSPLGGGRLFAPKTERDRAVADLFQRLSGTYDLPIDALAYAWIRCLPSKPCIILGSGKVERLKRAVASLDFEFPMEDWFAVLQASRGHGIA